MNTSDREFNRMCDLADKAWDQVTQCTTDTLKEIWMSQSNDLIYDEDSQIIYPSEQAMEAFAFELFKLVLRQ